jgi:hypothetical protein
MWKTTFLNSTKQDKKKANYLFKIEKPKLSLSLDGTTKLGRPRNLPPDFFSVDTIARDRPSSSQWPMVFSCSSKRASQLGQDFLEYRKAYKNFLQPNSSLFDTACFVLTVLIVVG